MTNTEDVTDIIFMLREQDFDDELVSKIRDMLSDEWKLDED